MNSRQPVIKDAKHMSDLIYRVLSAGQPGGAAVMDDELLALLASGRLRELPKDQQQRLLANVASDPDAAELVRRLSALGLGSRSEDRSNQTTIRIVRIAWAAAACLTIGLFISRWVLPTPPAPSSTVRPYEAPGTPDYWGQLDQQRLQERQQWYQCRDIALAISTATCGLLAIGLVLVGIRRKGDGAG